MDIGSIKTVYKDTGHWLARCNHDAGVIELNRRDFPRLSPLMRDYIWCHEYVHLLYEEYDEDKTNAIVDRIFVSRGKNDSERRRRIEFLLKSRDGESMAGVGVLTAIRFGIGKVVDIVKDAVHDARQNKAVFEANENSGFNALNDDQKKAYIDGYLKQSFREARRSSTRSAYSFFMYRMEPLLTAQSINSYALLLSRYKWIADYVDKYEKEYGFGFYEVTPADYSDLRPYIIAAAIMLALAVVLIIKYKTKK